MLVSENSGNRTQENILLAGKKEFLQKGFKDASMRSIAEAAGVTTGAIYGYYKDKNAVFSALVSQAAEGLFELYDEAHEQFFELSLEEMIRETSRFSTRSLRRFFDYIYDHFEYFKLIVCCSAGTEYENYLDRLVEVEMKGTRHYFLQLKEKYPEFNMVQDNLIHILANAYLSSVFETVVHDMSKAEALKYISGLTDFFSAGWERILNLKDLVD